MVQFTEIDTFRALQQAQAKLSFKRYTLFPETPWPRIRRRDAVRRLHACLNEIRPAVVCINGWSFGGAIAALIWCLSNRVPAIVMCDSTAFDHQRRWWKEAVKQRIVSLCSAALVAGSPHRDYLVALGTTPDRIFMGYDAVDNDHFRSGARAARGMESDLRVRLALPQRYFMACCRFTPKKNLSRLIRAYARYRQSAGSTAWSLVIVGEGELKDELVALRDRLGLGASVQFAGPKNYLELPAYYGLASAFVHASTTEQWGLVVNEAMASGLPVLVSERCGCAQDLVQPGVNGILFNPTDIDALARAMRDVARESCDRQAMGQASQEIVAHWSPDHFAKNLAKAAEAALHHAKPVPSLVDRALLNLLCWR
jgi:glycosyltransferase involved in cell wall biosynthesis